VFLDGVVFVLDHLLVDEEFLTKFFVFFKGLLDLFQISTRHVDFSIPILDKTLMFFR